MLTKENSWCAQELSNINTGDVRLDQRLLSVAENLLNNPKSPIIESQGSWQEAKAAYRLFDNEKLSDDKIKSIHIKQTVKRLQESQENLFFVLQDTTTLNYTHHPKKQGMGKIHHGSGYSNGLHGCFLHTSLLMSASCQPLGFLHQKIYQHDQTRTRLDKKQRPITEKESYKWLEGLKNTKNMCGNKNVITICDRESDIYEFYEAAINIDASILVRAAYDRIVFGKKNTLHSTLWSYMAKQPIVSEINIEIPATRGRPKRQANLEVRFAEIEFNPPQRSSKAKINELSPLKLTAIWLYENSNVDNKLEWMLLTNCTIKDADDAVRVGQYYKHRWQIENYHRILKSGCNIENCRLETYSRLKRYIALKSIIAYRLFYLTMIARTKPNECCEIALSTNEWQSLYCYVHKAKKIPDKPPSNKEALRMIAILGGFPARKNDGEPGMTSIWRGWNKLIEIAKIWEIMTYG